MSDGIDHGNPFADPDLWAKSSLLDQRSDVLLTTLPILPALHTSKTEWPNIETSNEDAFAFRKSEESSWLEPETSNPVPNELADDTEILPANDDAWSLSSEDIKASQQAPGRSWAQCADPAFKDPIRYFSEAGIGIFDTVIRKRVPSKAGGRALKPDVLIRSLLQLGLGRDSTLFTFKPDGTYITKVAEPRMYGLTHECTSSIVERFGNCGQLFRSIKKQIARLYGRQKCPPTGIAAAQTVSSILLELDTQVTAKSPAQSLLQLQAAFQAPFMVLTLLRDILISITKMSTNKAVLDYLYELAQEVERSDSRLKALMAQVLARASEPWLRAVSSCIGLRPAEPASDGLRSLLIDDAIARQNDHEHTDDPIFPAWFSEPDRALVCQTFEGMVLMESQGRQDSTASDQTPRQLAWRFSWADVLQSEPGRQPSSPGLIVPSSAADALADLSIFGFDESIQSTNALQEMYSMFEAKRPKQDDGEDLSAVIEQLLDDNHTPNSTSDMSFAIAANASFRTMLTTRANVINHACLRELFKLDLDRNSVQPLSFTYHLTVLNRFLLMTDGMFTTRLSHALFDPELASAERSKGKVRAGKMGLRLGSRTTWPPASSELQLALMGILASSFENEQTSARSDNLPGDISFALRQLSEDEIERCLDQESLEALDFLRVQYRPQPPLHAIVTQTILDKYDAIQKLLLRITRLVFVINNSSRIRFQNLSKDESSSTAALRFAHAAHHFVTAFADYLLNTAIGANWARFTAEMSQLERALSDGKLDITQYRSVAYIRSRHEETLDSIMFACLLRRRHEKVRGLFDDILRLVLQFATLQDHQEGAVEDLYSRFKKQTTVFVTVCKELGERASGSGWDEDGLQALVTRLMMNDFYSSNAERALRL